MSENPVKITKPAIRSLLKRMGFDEREADIYMALLPLKMAKVSMIATAAHQPRSYTYLILQELEKKGLVSRLERGKVLHFVAESPSRLITYLLGKEEEIQSLKTLVNGIIPYLSNLSGPTPHEPRVVVSKGLEQMKQIYRDVFSHEFVAIFNAKSMYDTFEDGLVRSLFHRDIQLKGRELVVRNEGAKRFVKERSTGKGLDCRILPPGIDFEADICMFGDTITLFGYDDQFTVIRIDHPQIARTLRTFFEFVWLVSQPTNILGKLTGSN